MSKIFPLIVLILVQIQVFSQTEQLSGKVVSQDLALKGIEVINFNSKKSVITNDLGEFKIAAKENDVIILLTDNYLNKSIIISKNDIIKTITINLVARPIELDNVKIRAKESVKNLVTYDDLAKIRIEKENSPLRNAAIYDGKMINGADFIQIGRMIGKLFKKKGKNKSKVLAVDFKEYSKLNFSDDFFDKTLELKPNQRELFLDFCQADPKSKDIAQSEVEFIILDFLITKKGQFIALLAENKN